MATNTSIIQSVKERERKAFMAIPGMKEYLMASPLDKEKIAAVYPDVTFALMVADSIVGHGHILTMIRILFFLEMLI